MVAGFRPAHAEMEPLEGRLLMSGNVEAFVTDGGDLMISGDKAGNAIAVTVGLAGEILISGDAHTTVNGEASATLTGLTGDIILRMGDGNDEVALTGLTVGGDLRFDGGRGDNELTVDSTGIGGDVRVKNLMGAQAFSLLNASNVGGSVKIDNAQKGDTAVTIDASTITGGLHVNNKDGKDTFTLRGSSVGGSVIVNNHKGDSETTLDAAAVGGDFSLKSMKGSDRFDALNAVTIDGKTKIATGDKRALISLAALTTARLQIQTGNANDQVTLDAVAVAQDTNIQLGKGRDELTVLNGLAPGFSGTVKIDLGQDDDTATITAAFGGSVMVNGGKGSDSLDWLTGSTFAQAAQVVQVETIAPAAELSLPLSLHHE